MTFISPVISSLLIPLKILSPNEVIEEGIEILLKLQHLLKA